MPIDRDTVTGRAYVDRETQHVHDLQAAGEEFPLGQELAHRVGFRTIAATPLMREGEAIGALVIRRTEVRPFSDKQIELLKTFADQAAIAIQNVRLFKEVQAKTHDLERIADIPEGDQRCARGDRQVGINTAACPRRHCRYRRRPVRGRHVGDKADEGWGDASRRIKQPHRPYRPGLRQGPPDPTD